MYIKKYWYNYIGGTDDSLTLVDYLYDKGKTEIPLSEIFNDTGLSKLNWNFHISPNLEYIDSEGQCHEFYYAAQGRRKNLLIKSPFLCVPLLPLQLRQHFRRDTVNQPL